MWAMKKRRETRKERKEKEKIQLIEKAPVEREISKVKELAAKI
jgi:hypothetical protein